MIVQPQFDKTGCSVSNKGEPHRCVACSSTHIQTVLVQPDFTIEGCMKCEMAFTSPSSYVTHSHYDINPNLASGYAKQESLFRNYSRQVLGYVKPYIRSGKLLDVGCSIGLLVDEAVRVGFNADGIDLDDNAIAYGKSHSRNLYHIALQDWGDKEYDVICLQHTLEHIMDPIAFLKCCADHLRTGGYVIVVVPCYLGLIARVLGRRWYGWMASQHYFHFSPVALSTLFRSAGLEPTRIWRDSMDHWPRREYVRTLKDLLKGIGGYSLATLGASIGQGDQLIGIASLPGR